MQRHLGMHGKVKWDKLKTANAYESLLSDEEFTIKPEHFISSLSFVSYDIVKLRMTSLSNTHSMLVILQEMFGMTFMSPWSMASLTKGRRRRQRMWRWRCLCMMRKASSWRCAVWPRNPAAITSIFTITIDFWPYFNSLHQDRFVFSWEKKYKDC